MARLTIDYGIDLGTTNSSVAVMGKHGPEVIRNREGSELTPSAVYVDRSGALHVGKFAKERLTSDPENSASEFKRWMGTQQKKAFKRTGLIMTPEELSAEVLKSLKRDVKQMRNEELEAAVITVPADFDTPQCVATGKAAKLAGIVQSHLLQEPVAAAMAYGFGTESQRAFWLVYDFGGGTFDAAIVTVRDGQIPVVGHQGDNQFGGKDIDWTIVDRLLVPTLQKQFMLSDFHRGNQKWASAFGKLKIWAEDAKIQLSDRHRASIDLFQDYLCKDDNGDQVELEYTLTRAHVEALVEPLTLRAIEICRRVLVEQKLGPGDIEKLILVGGPTLTPHMRDMLQDPKVGLGIPLEFSDDAFTIVARGAAIFAGTQKRTPISTAPPAKGAYRLDLEYKPMSLETEPLVGGRVTGAKQESLSGFTISFVNPDSKPAWRSGKIKLSADGAFVTTMWAEAHRQNTFLIELFDPTGKQCPVEPAQFNYTVSVEPGSPTLPHHIMVEQVGNKVDVFFRRGSTLPIKTKRHRHLTTKELKRWASGQLLRIPVVEGLDEEEADMNRLIGFIEINSEQVKRDIPLGTEVEIILQLDESRRLSGSAYIPILDEEYLLQTEGTLLKPIPSPDKLEEDFFKQKRRIEELKAKAREIEDPAARREMSNLDDPGPLAEISQLLAGAREADTALTCQNRLQDLKRRLREIERAIEIPALKLETKQEIESCNEVVEAHGTTEDRNLWSALRPELIAAMDGAPENLRRNVDEAHQLWLRISVSQPSFWIGMFEYLKIKRPEMADQDSANKWFPHVERSISNGDFEALKSGCRQLLALLPMEELPRGYGGTTILAKDSGFGSSSV